VLIGGVDSFDAGWFFEGARLLLLLLLVENFPAVCLVTAAAMPLASLAFFLSFLGIHAARGEDLEQFPAPREPVGLPPDAVRATPRTRMNADTQAEAETKAEKVRRAL
jgi:hypothetical protein